MGSLADIKRRLESVKQTRRITGAMKTVSVAKMRKASDSYEKSRAYAELIDKIMNAAAGGEYSGDCEYFSQDGKARSGKKYVVVLSTDRGLCGGFDHDVLRFADGVIDNDSVVMSVGRAATEYYKDRAGVEIEFSRCYSVQAANAKRIADRLLELYESGAREISIVYFSARKPVNKVLLPIQKPHDGGCNNVLLEPSRDEIINTLVPLYLSSSVYSALQSHVVSEHSARQAAMTAATDSADKLIGMLSVQYNRARQASVTEQIIEIIGATSAIGGSGGGNEKRS